MGEQKQLAAHIPVLTRPLIDLLKPKGGETILDCTVGTGGHAEQLLSKAESQGGLIGLDLDQSSLDSAARRLSKTCARISLHRRNFAEVDEVLEELGIEAVDLIMADLGISSAQLDDPRRGLSFQLDGPLDMRLDDRLETTAADLVNSLNESRLADLIFSLSGERHSRRIAKRIRQVRLSRRIRTTSELRDLVYGAIPRKQRRPGSIHPATRTFMALRIAVNDELENLRSLLSKAADLLKPGGRIAVISFHSGEDILVKRSFRDGAKSGVYRILTPKPVRATDQERRENPRSRSAKLRVAERIDRSQQSG